MLSPDAVQRLLCTLGELFQKLAERKESRIGKEDLLPNYARILISIPPKHTVWQVIWYIKRARFTLA